MAFKRRHKPIKTNKQTNKQANKQTKQKKKRRRNGIDRGNVMEDENYESWLQSPLNLHILVLSGECILYRNLYGTLSYLADQNKVRFKTLNIFPFSLSVWRPLDVRPLSISKSGALITPPRECWGRTHVTNQVWMEKRLRNLYEHELFYSDSQMPMIYNFH